MHGCAETKIDNIREEVAPGVSRYKPELRRELLLVAAAGVAAELLSVHSRIPSDAAIALFQHEDQLGDRTAITEILGRPLSQPELADLVQHSASVLEPFISALLEEAERLKRTYRSASSRLCGVLYYDVLDEIVLRILIDEQHAP